MLDKAGYPELEQAIANQVEEAGLINHPSWRLKLIQVIICVASCFLLCMNTVIMEQWLRPLYLLHSLLEKREAFRYFYERAFVTD